MKIGITGASGFIGSHLLEFLVNSGHEITCLLRNTTNSRWVEHVNFNRIAGDLNNIDGLREFVSSNDIIFHCAGKTKSPNRAGFYETNVVGTQNLIKAAAEYNSNLRHFIYLSSQEVAGEVNDDIPINETKLLRPVTMYGKSKAESEEILESYKDKLPITILRPAPVYGPRDKDVLVFFRLVSRGIEPRFPVESKISVIYIENLINALNLVMNNKKTFGKQYYVADDGYFTWTEMSRLIKDETGNKTRPFYFPRWMIKAASCFSKFTAKMFGIVPALNSEKLKVLMLKNLMVDTTSLKMDIGIFSITDIHSAVQTTYNWYKAFGWLK